MEKLTERVLSFWFGSLKLQRALVAPIQPSMFKLWFGADTDTDRRIADEFGPSIRSIATDPALQDTLLATLDGAMALIILLDQMTRNAFRNTPESFAYDHIALRTTKLIVDRKWDHQLPAVYRGFAYLVLASALPPSIPHLPSLASGAFREHGGPGHVRPSLQAASRLDPG